MIISKKKLLSILGAVAAAIAAITAVLTGGEGSKLRKAAEIDPKVCNEMIDLHECEISNSTYYRVD